MAEVINTTIVNRYYVEFRHHGSSQWWRTNWRGHSNIDSARVELDQQHLELDWPNANTPSRGDLRIVEERTQTVLTVVE